MTHVRPVGPSERDRGEVCIRSANGSERFYDRAVYTVEQAGEVLGLKRSAAFKAAKEGKLPTVDLPGGQRVTASALDKLLHPDEWPEVEAEPEPEPDEPEPTPYQKAHERYSVEKGYVPPGRPAPTPTEAALTKAHDEHVKKSLLQYSEKPPPRKRVEYERLPEVETTHGPLGGGAILPDGQSEPYNELDELGTSTPSGTWVGHYIPFF